MDKNKQTISYNDLLKIFKKNNIHENEVLMKAQLQQLLSDYKEDNIDVLNITKLDNVSLESFDMGKVFGFFKRVLSKSSSPLTAVKMLKMSTYEIYFAMQLFDNFVQKVGKEIENGKFDLQMDQLSHLFTSVDSYSTFPPLDEHSSEPEYSIDSEMKDSPTLNDYYSDES